MKARKGPKGDVADIPANMKAEAEEARIKLMEAAAEGDDEFDHEVSRWTGTDR